MNLVGWLVGWLVTPGFSVWLGRSVQTHSDRQGKGLPDWERLDGILSETPNLDSLHVEVPCISGPSQKLLGKTNCLRFCLFFWGGGWGRLGVLDDGFFKMTCVFF